MANSPLSNVVTKNNVWKGAARLVYAPTGTSFPGKLESIIQPGTPSDPHAVAYTLSATWVDLGATTPDGVTITRAFEAEEGVQTDQLQTPLFAGDPSVWTMQLSTTLLETDYGNLAVAWELPAVVSYSADTSGPDYKVAQKKLKFSAPDTLTERLFAVIQQHSETNLLRVFAFRKVKLGPEGMELPIQGSTASSLAQTWLCHADTGVDQDEDTFGVVFEEQSA